MTKLVHYLPEVKKKEGKKVGVPAPHFFPPHFLKLLWAFTQFSEKEFGGLVSNVI